MNSYASMYQKAQEEGTLQALTPVFHKWSNDEPLVIGEYVSREEVPSKQNPENKFWNIIFKTDAGLTSFNLSQFVEESAEIRMEEGHIYAVEFKGREKTGKGFMVNKFTIFEIPKNAADKLADNKSTKPALEDKEDGNGNKKKD